MTTGSGGTIYALSDPRDGAIRYIGKTGGPILRRLSQHIATPTNPAMKLWINSLASQGLTPNITTIANVPFARLDEEEKRQIVEHAKNHRLFNHPYYRHNMADIAKLPKTQPSSGSRRALFDARCEKLARQCYRQTARGRIDGRKSLLGVVVDIVMLTPFLTLGFLWHLLARVIGDRLRSSVAWTALLTWAAWNLGYDDLVRDFVLARLPQDDMAAFWDDYLAAPMRNTAIAASAFALLCSAMAYHFVHEAIGRERASAKVRKPAPVKAAPGTAVPQPRPQQPGR